MDAPLLVTLGDLRLDGAGAPALAHHRKELVLLAYLARRGGPVSRDELAELLWGASGEPRARQSLRQALASIRRALPGALDTTGDHAVRLCPGAVWLDAALLEADVRAGRHAEAVARWGGEFLPRADDVGHDGFRCWLETERASLRRRLCVALEQLLDGAEAGGGEDAVRWAGRWAA